MNHLIIATHAELAKGYQSAINMFFPGTENVSYLSAYIEYSNFEEVLQTELDLHVGSTIIVLTDILGGSVNQVACRKLAENDFYLISSLNLAIVFGLLTETEDLTEDNLIELIEDAKYGIQLMNLIFKKG